MSGRLVVYSNRITRVDDLAALLGCPAYHSELTVEARSDAYRRLRAGKINIVVVTNGLGFGINVLNIYGVIHTEIPYKLRDYG
jgi:superfamily II DNA helicase RecQ